MYVEDPNACWAGCNGASFWTDGLCPEETASTSHQHTTTPASSDDQRDDTGSKQPPPTTTTTTQGDPNLSCTNVNCNNGACVVEDLWLHVAICQCYPGFKTKKSKFCLNNPTHINCTYTMHIYTYELAYCWQRL